ncbi:MAG: OstA-like protein, partial [Chitinophagales bacterium]
YVNGGEVTDGEAVLTSDLGYYYAYTKDAFFKSNVVLKHPQYGLEADTLQYNTGTEKAIFRGPTHIYNKESTVYCEKGYYESNTGIAVFYQNVKMENAPQELRADSIYYNRETGIGKAFHHIIFSDTSQNALQYSEFAEYDEIHNTIFSTGGSIAGYVMENDTLFIGGDTIRSFSDSLKRRTMFVFHHVKIFKSDLQGRCDSLFYSDVDSIIRMYGLPVMWSDSTQFTADTINMIIKNKHLDEIRLFSNGFIVNEDDSLIYNQIKGRNIFGYFTDEELTKIKALGNGESIYFGKDDDGKYIGVNKMFCSEIFIYLNNKKFHKISFHNAPTSEFEPMQKIDVLDYQLKNFDWQYNERPRSREDLLTPDPDQEKDTENPNDIKLLQKDG